MRLHFLTKVSSRNCKSPLMRPMAVYDENGFAYVKERGANLFVNSTLRIYNLIKLNQLSRSML